MCRLFGMHAGAADVAATFWLLDAADSLAAQSHRNPDGAGMGVFGPDGTPTVSKQPIAAWSDAEFATSSRDLRGTTFVAHVRYASTGAHTTANTHPFLQDQRLFAHNGVVQGLPELDAHLADLGVADLVQGQTDSERVFALITAEIRRHARRHARPQARPQGGDLGRGLVEAIGWVADRLPVYALNLVLATATDLWALRYPATHELYVLEREPGGGPARNDRLEARTRRIHARSEDLSSQPCVLVASERMDDDPGWRLLEPGELLHVDSTLRVHSTTPFPTEPRHLLTLSDLDATTAASQHPMPSRG